MEFTDRKKRVHFQRLVTSISRFLRRTDQHSHDHGMCVYFFVFVFVRFKPSKIVNLMVNNDVLVFSTIDNKCS